MSSILKALKRVEKGEDATSESSAWPAPVHSQPAMARENGIGARRLAWLVVSIAVVSALGWMAWHRYMADTPAVSSEKTLAEVRKAVQPPSQPQPQPLKPAPVPSSTPSSGRSPMPREKPVPPMASETGQTGPHPKSKPKSPPSQPPMPGEAPLSRPPSGAPPGPSPESNRSSMAPEPILPIPSKTPVESLSETPDVPSPGTETVSGNAQPLKEGRLVLQAIAWTRIAEKRMAVVSNEVVKEGGNVQGFEVVRIEENGVLLKEKGQIWSLGYPK